MPSKIQNCARSMGKFFGFLTFCIGIAQICFVLYVQLQYVIPHSETNSFLKGLGICYILITASMAFICDFRCCLSDPGYVHVTANNILTEEEISDLEYKHHPVCKYCHIEKPIRAHHCSQCNHCILKMDHHCPWINNCVGVKNQKYFLLFLIYVFLGETYAFISGLIRIYTMLNTFNSQSLNFIQKTVSLPKISFSPFSVEMKQLRYFSIYMGNGNDYFFTLVLEVIFSIMFALFSFAMLIDQCQDIFYDVTYIEYLKSSNITSKTESYQERLENTMGEPYCYHWFLPIEGRYMKTYINKLEEEHLVNTEFNDVIVENEQVLEQRIQIEQAIAQSNEQKENQFFTSDIKKDN
ncbi:hypothetical protein WA158_007978 [Blastocystis sp. Blastoise]